MKKVIKRILMVDDESEFCKSVQRHLRQEGYEIDIADNGLSAYNRLLESSINNNKYDLLITDVLMPKMNGFELAEKTTSLYPKMSILFISGYLNITLIREFLRENLDSCLSKPFEPNEMLGIIKNLDQQRIKVDEN